MKSNTPIYLFLYHGRTIDPVTGAHENLDDWGSDGPVFAIENLHVTYGVDFRIYSEAADLEANLTWHEDLIYYDGIGYGDWCVVGSLDDAMQDRLVPYDEAKAKLPEFSTPSPA